MTAISPHDAWAVGFSSDFDDDPLPLFEHWNGKAWQVAPGPSEGPAMAILNAVDTASSSDVWAVGDDRTPGFHPPVFEHWNGSAWQHVPGAALFYGELQGVTALSATNAWAVGSAFTKNAKGHPLIEHWDGLRWSRVSAPRIPVPYAFYSVSAVSSSDVWAVGTGGRNSRRNTITAHWDGASWTIVPSPTPPNPLPGYPPYGVLTAVSARASDDGWAVGYSALGTLVEHWDGTAWSIVPSSSPGDATLAGVVAVGPKDAWAVGVASLAGGSKGGRLIEHWNGKRWSVAVFDRDATRFSFLTSVAAAAPDYLWAVGAYGHEEYKPDATLTMRYCAAA